VSKPRFANIFAGLVGVLVGAGAMYLSYTKLKQPQILIDWLALTFCGLTTGIIAFFVVWGHFQRDPEQSSGA
jgi:multisubunit Na+/H+ antiporter MnhB subunit